MLTIEEEGFLGIRVRDWIDGIRSKYSDFFELATDVNKVCQKVMLELDVKSRNSRGIIVASLYIRSLNTFQGLYLLAERGMMAQARILARALMEGLFTLCAISKKPELFDVLIKEDKKNRLKFLSKYRAFHGGKLPDTVDQTEIEAIEKELKANVKKESIRRRNTEEWAEDAGLTSWYLTAYAVLSDSVHVKVRDLEDHLRIDERAEIVEFLWGPDDRDVAQILMTGIETMHFALGCTLSFFRVQRDKEIKELRSRFEKLIPKISSL